MGEHLKITFNSSVEQMRELNSSFDYGVLKVAYTGANRNGSFISKESFEKSIDTIYNCPIVCNYNRELDQIGSHDVEVVMKDGSPTIVNITQPVGVIPESAKYWWAEYEDDSGVHEYLCVETLIWKRQEAYAKIKENGITDESMEIKVIDGHMDNGIFVIDSFEFLAFCLLESAEPCYESASLQVFSNEEFAKAHAKMMEEFKTSFKQVNTSIEDDIHPQTNSKGGEEQLEQKIELLAKFGYTAENIDIDIESMSIEDLEAELNERKNAANQFALTGEQFREGLWEALEAEKIETCWGTMSRYMYYDYNADVNEVYCYDAEDWKLYGFTYSMNGDNIVVDFATKKRKKFLIADFDEGDLDLTYEHMFKSVADVSASHKETELTSQFASVKAELEDKYNAASDTIKELNTEIDSLRQFQQTKLKEERDAAEDAVFSMFGDLNGVEAFESLRNDCAELTIEELTEKCYALRGRTMPVQTFSNEKNKAPRLPIERQDGKDDDDEYGGIFKRFPPKH